MKVAKRAKARIEALHDQPLVPCTICQHEFPKGSMGQWGNAKGTYVCKECRSHMNRFDRFGILPQEYDELLELQDFKCAICRDPLEFGSNASVVDHCHGTERVRGVLCRRCNSGLGLFRDRRDLLDRAKEYLHSPVAQIPAKKKTRINRVKMLQEYYAARRLNRALPQSLMGLAGSRSAAASDLGAQ